MKINLVSDLHTNKYQLRNRVAQTVAEACDRVKLMPEDLKKGVCDLLIIAGDLDDATYHFLDETEIPILIIPGNHDYWFNSEAITFDGAYMDPKATTVDGLKQELIKAFTHNPLITVLDNDKYEIEEENLVILGSTLWTAMENPFGVFQTGHIREAVKTMKDFSYITVFENNPCAWRERHQESVAWLEKELHQALITGKEVIVVTHMGPSFKSCANKYQGESMNKFYFSNLEPLIRKYRPSIWAHGHTHESCLYKIGDTEVHCNPQGYMGLDMNLNFNKHYLLWETKNEDGN